MNVVTTVDPRDGRSRSADLTETGGSRLKTIAGDDAAVVRGLVDVPAAGVWVASSSTVVGSA
ncbi:hypothetical protein [Micromonospora avicenniae]|uniref:hypothetical protein n=1 Tax=Micromonospora avicenniae TaxID=1198245 RepID=UPI00333429DC